MLVAFSNRLRTIFVQLSTAWDPSAPNDFRTCSASLHDCMETLRDSIPPSVIKDAASETEPEFVSTMARATAERKWISVNLFERIRSAAAFTKSVTFFPPNSFGASSTRMHLILPGTSTMLPSFDEKLKISLLSLSRWRRDWKDRRKGNQRHTFRSRPRSSEQLVQITIQSLNHYFDSANTPRSRLALEKVWSVWHRSATNFNHLGWIRFLSGWHTLILSGDYIAVFWRTTMGKEVPKTFLHGMHRCCR